LENVEDETILNCVGTNIIGSLLCSKYVIRVLKTQEKGGHIFEMNGFGSHDQVQSGLTVYGMTKKACDYMGRSISAEYNTTNIGIHSK
jgi:chlorophyll(ide) b reductase